jgi:FkbM family methyltransferase
MLKKIFNHFGYSLSKLKKAQNLSDIIEFRLKNNSCDTLLDVGANHGDFTREFLHNFKKCMLFEPNPNLFNTLKEKFKNNSNIEIYDCGIDILNKKKKFYITNDSGQTLSSLKKQTNKITENLKNTKIVKQIDAKFNRLDFVLKDQNKKIFLKTDTQGNELEVLQSLGKYIENIHFIKCEMPVINLYKINYSFWDILDFLKKFNFIPVFFENGLRDSNGNLIEYDIFFEKKNEI